MFHRIVCFSKKFHPLFQRQKSIFHGIPPIFPAKETLDTSLRAARELGYGSPSRWASSEQAGKRAPRPSPGRRAPSCPWALGRRTPGPPCRREPRGGRRGGPGCYPGRRQCPSRGGQCLRVLAVSLSRMSRISRLSRMSRMSRAARGALWWGTLVGGVRFALLDVYFG